MRALTALLALIYGVRPQPTPRKKGISGADSLLIDSARQWAALAFMVFSLAPMLILVIAVAGAFFGEETVRLELFSHLRDLIGERGGRSDSIGAGKHPRCR